MTEFSVAVSYADDGPENMPHWQATAVIAPAPDTAVMFSATGTGLTRAEAHAAMKRAVRDTIRVLLEARI